MLAVAGNLAGCSLPSAAFSQYSHAFKAPTAAQISCSLWRRSHLSPPLCYRGPLIQPRTGPSCCRYLSFSSAFEGKRLTKLCQRVGSPHTLKGKKYTVSVSARLLDDDANNLCGDQENEEQNGGNRPGEGGQIAARNAGGSKILPGNSSKTWHMTFALGAAVMVAVFCASATPAYAAKKKKRQPQKSTIVLIKEKAAELAVEYARREKQLREDWRQLKKKLLTDEKRFFDKEGIIRDRKELMDRVEKLTASHKAAQLENRKANALRKFAPEQPKRAAGARGGQVNPDPSLGKRVLGREKAEVLLSTKDKAHPGEYLQVIRHSDKEVMAGQPPLALRRVTKGGVRISRPGAHSTLRLGWQKWAQVQRMKKKRELLADPKKARRYLREKMAKLVEERDRILSMTWVNASRRNRPEMSVLAVSSAIRHRLVARARFSPLRDAMLVTLKGDGGREFYAALTEYDEVHREVGGVDTLLERCRDTGARVTVERWSDPYTPWGERLARAGRAVLFSPAVAWRPVVGCISSLGPQYLRITNRAAQDWTVLIIQPFWKYWPIKPFPASWFEVQQLDRLAKRYPLLRQPAEDAILWLTTAELAVRDRVDANRPSNPSFRQFVNPLILFWLPVRTGVAFLPFAVLRWLLVAIPPLFVLYSKPTQAEAYADAARRHNSYGEEAYAQLYETEYDASDLDGCLKAAKRVRDPPIRLADFPGISHVKDELWEVVSFLKDPKKFKELGAPVPRGILVVGEENATVDKLIKAMAAEARVPVIDCKYSVFEAYDFVGSGPVMVRGLFEGARDMAPCILWLDELEFFANTRKATLDPTLIEKENLLNQLLVEIDGFETTEGIMIVATSKNPDSIDPALVRSGRIDRRISLSRAQEGDQMAILQTAARAATRPDLEAVINWDYIAEEIRGQPTEMVESLGQGIEHAVRLTKTREVDRDELRNVCNFLELYELLVPEFVRKTRFFQKWEAGLLDWLGQNPEVTPEDVQKLFYRMDFAGQHVARPEELYKRERPWTREFKRPHAVWAAGKSLVIALLPRFDLFWGCSLDRHGHSIGNVELGTSRNLKRALGMEWADQPVGREYYEQKLVALYASHAAATMLVPAMEMNNLALEDLENALSLAWKMVMLSTWGKDGSPFVYQHPQSAYTGLPMDAMEEVLEEQVDELMTVACDRAQSILERNRAALDALVEHLLEHDSVSPEEMERILRETGGVKEAEPFYLLPFNTVHALSGGSTKPQPALVGSSR